MSHEWSVVDGIWWLVGLKTREDILHGFTTVVEILCGGCYAVGVIRWDAPVYIWQRYSLRRSVKV